MNFVLFVANVLVWGFVFRFFGRRIFGKRRWLTYKNWRINNPSFFRKFNIGYSEG